MTEILLPICVGLMVALLILQLVTFFRNRVDLAPLIQALSAVEQSLERNERSLRAEIASSRGELADSSQKTRTELHSLLRQVAKLLLDQLTTIAKGTDSRLAAMRDTVEQRLDIVQRESGEKLDAIRVESSAAAKSAREEVTASLKSFCEVIVKASEDLGASQRMQLSQVVDQLTKLTDANDKKLEANRVTIDQRLAQMQTDAALADKQARDELSASLKSFNDTLLKSMADVLTQMLAMAKGSDEKLGAMRDTIEQRLDVVQRNSNEKLDAIRVESNTAAKTAREEVTTSLKTFCETIAKSCDDLSSHQRMQLSNVIEQLGKLTEANDKKLEAHRTTLDQRLLQMQTDSSASSKQAREELGLSLKNFNDSVLKNMNDMSNIQTTSMEALKLAVEAKLKGIQEDNSKQLEQMRLTVDEKLQGTLEKRLGESFKLVSERLEQVHKGLGEMQALASGVGDLKRVLTNVKSRGTWGEVQLAALLEQVLTGDQYAANVATKGGGERVEFAIKLPGKGDSGIDVVWLPIDAKFPIEDYQRLVEAQERADTEAIDAAGRQLEMRIKGCARDICEKYISPPYTTDFGILFLPTEGLFAEVIRRIGLADFVQRECRVVVAGPSTLWSLLSSLQMGFRTLAIEQRSSEVWKLLGAVKTEWGKYGEVLNKVQKKLQEASNTIDQAQVRTRVIGRKLRGVEELPALETEAVLLLRETPLVDVIDEEAV